MPERKRVLITVKTYPIPSQKYVELVCTAGVLEDGTFIRLYPIDFRYRPIEQTFKKYQWVDVEVEKNEKDKRKESFRPILDSLKPLSTVLAPDGHWKARARYVLRQRAKSMEQLLEAQERDDTSLGIIRPRQVQEFIVEPDAAEWKPSQRAVLQQMSLFGPERRPLEKIPYKFSYRFTCDDDRCKGHQMMIADWEVGQLFLKMRDRFKDPEVAVEKVRQKFWGQLCAPDKDVHFFVGTVFRFGTWIVLGVFYPRKEEEPTPRLL